MDESKIIYEKGDFFVLKSKFGYEVYKIGLTHSTRCAQIGWPGEKGINKAIEEINRRIADNS